MNSDGIYNKPKTRQGWAKSLKKNAESTLKRTSIQASQPGFAYAPNGKASPPKGILIPNTQAFTDRFSETKQLARYVFIGGETVAEGFDLTAFVYTPSTRLRCRMEVYFEPDNQLLADPVFVTVPNWRIMNMSRNPFSGRESTLQQLYPQGAGGPVATNFNANVEAATGTAPLPDQFTLDSCGELVRVDVHLDNDQLDLAYSNGPANAFLTVHWEPNVPMTPSELASFYRDCKVVYGQAKLIATAPP